MEPMDLQYPALDACLLSFPGVEKDFKEEWGWHRYKVGGKQFAALCCPGPEHKDYAGRPLVNLNCDPRLSELYRQQYPEVLPGFYMDKKNWIAACLDGDLTEEFLVQLCKDSYGLVAASLTKKAQRELGLLE